MPNVIALIPTDLQRGRLGLASRVSHPLAGRSVLARTLDRVARVPGVSKIVLVHPAGQSPRESLGGATFGKPVENFADPAGLSDAYLPMRTAARKWSPHAWRGGLGGMTCYDELLPAAPLLAALREHNADAALLVGADWCLVDPAWCQKVIDLHVEHPEAMQFTFTQAPPGLCGAVAGASLLQQLAENPAATIGQILGYVPSRPQADPIGRDVCVQIPPGIRGCAKRFIYDTPRAAAMIDALGATIDEDAAAITDAVSSAACGFALLPQQVTLELTPVRPVNGPLTPQHYVLLNRPPISLDSALRVVEQVGKAGDVALTLGGLGDALLCPHWDQIVTAARDAGVLSICIETDLHVDKATLHKLVELPVDVVSVRLNADRATNYERLMGSDRFSNVIGAMQHLFEIRGKRKDKAGVPWMVPRLVKTPDTLEDLEAFFDKWVHYLGHAVIEPATSGCGLMPELSPVNMAPPRRRPCRQIAGRMTVHSDGRVARCDQDWLARGAAGDVTMQELPEIWKSLDGVRARHDAGEWNELDLCGSCHEWHRP